MSVSTALLGFDPQLLNTALLCQDPKPWPRSLELFPLSLPLGTFSSLLSGHFLAYQYRYYFHFPWKSIFLLHRQEASVGLSGFKAFPEAGGVLTTVVAESPVFKAIVIQPAKEPSVKT